MKTNRYIKMMDAIMKIDGKSREIQIKNEVKTHKGIS